MARRIDWDRMERDLEEKVGVVGPLIDSAVNQDVFLTTGKKPPRIYATVDYPQGLVDSEEDYSEGASEVRQRLIQELGEVTQTVGRIMRENGLKDCHCNPHFNSKYQYVVCYGFDHEDYKK